jgi:hypothetical protein
MIFTSKTPHLKVLLLRLLCGAFFFLFTSHIFENKYEEIVY